MNDPNPSIWKVIHIFARTINITYIPEVFESFEYFLASVIELHPDRDYARKMKDFMMIEPIGQYMSSSDILFYWSYSFHYAVENGNQYKKRGKDDSFIGSYENFIEDYKLDKINKPFWGNPLWYVIHWLGSITTAKDVLVFKSFIYTLTKLMPCPKCKSHLLRNLKRSCFYIDDYKHDLFLFTFNLHNSVNNSIGKPLYKLSDAKKHYNVV
jgi:hypothetical protein